MKNKDKSWRKSIFRRLIISFVCILLPIFILSIVIYNWAISTLREKISNTMITQVSFYLEALEKDVQRIQKLQFDCLSDANLKQLASIPDSLSDMEKLQAILNLSQRVSAIKNSSAYIKDVTVLIPAIDSIVSSEGANPFDRSEFDNIRNIYMRNGVQVVNDKSGMFLYAAPTCVYVNGQKEPLFIISIELSKDRIRESISTMVSDSNEVIVFYTPKTNATIAVNYKPIFYEDIKNRLIDPEIPKTNGSVAVKIDGRSYLATYSASRFLGSTLCEYLPENSVFESLQKFRGWFVAFIIVSLTIIVIYSFYLHEFINKPLSTLTKSFKKIENGELDIRIDNKNDNEFGYIYKSFNAMVKNLNILIDQVYKQKILVQKQEILVQKAEMKQLQSQINPHFLYNSFFTLNAMSQTGDYDNLERFTEQLGEYFQFVTRNASDEVTFEKEVNHARIYTEIQAKRFSKRLKIAFDDLPERFAKLMVPRLILQPIIENAFEYGLEGKEKDGLLWVKFTDTSKCLKIIVEDNGSALDDDVLNKLRNIMHANTDDVEVTGMLNIYRRIQLKFGKQSGILFDKGELGGLRVTVYITLTEDGVHV